MTSLLRKMQRIGSNKHHFFINFNKKLRHANVFNGNKMIRTVATAVPLQRFTLSFMDHVKSIIPNNSSNSFSNQQQMNQFLSNSIKEEWPLRYQMIFQVIDCCIQLATETKLSFEKDPQRWLQYYQTLFTSIPNNYSCSLSWRRELARKARLDSNALQELSDHAKQIISVLQFHNTVMSDSGILVDGSVVSQFSQLILDSEIFQSVDSESFITRAEDFIQKLQSFENEENDYYLLSELVKALIHCRRAEAILDSIDFSPQALQTNSNLHELVSEIEEIMDESISDQPLIPLYYTLRKNFHMLLHQTTQSYESAIRNDCDILIDRLYQTKDAKTYSDRAVAFIDSHHLEKAAIDCQKALELNPFQSFDYFRLIALDLIRGNYLNAMNVYDEFSYAAQVQYPKMFLNNEILNYLKRLCESMCRKYIVDEQLASLVCDLLEYKHSLIIGKATNSEDEDSRRKIAVSLSKAKQLYPNDVELHTAIEIQDVSFSIMIERNIDDIVERLQSITAQFPENPSVLSLSASLFYHASHISSDISSRKFMASMAKEYYLLALDISNEQAVPQYRFEPQRAMVNLAAVTSDLGEEDDHYRIQLCTRAWEMFHPGSNSVFKPVILLYRSQYYANTGQKTEAVRDLDTLLSMDPFNVRALTYRRDLLQELQLDREKMLEDNQLLSALQVTNKS